MRAVVLDYLQRTLGDREIPEPPVPGPGEVLFRVQQVGVCGTDRELARFAFGHPAAGQSYSVLGHEAAGEVIAVGGGVPGFKRGDWVAPMIRRACSPACESCARNRRDLCVTGGFTERGIFGADGYFTELATDRAEDLVRVPGGREDYGVLIEPLSVVEKAVERALRAHAWQPRRALVLGAGTIGILSALVLHRHGLDVTVQSMEGERSIRARLLELAGLPYTQQFQGKVDIAIEAAGSAEAAMAGLSCLAPLGVLVVLGAKQATVDFPFLQLLLHNQVILGSINASPAGARAAVAHLAEFDTRVLDAMIERVPFGAYRQSILQAGGDKPKIVHMLR